MGVVASGVETAGLGVAATLVASGFAAMAVLFVSYGNPFAEEQVHGFSSTLPDGANLTQANFLPKLRQEAFYSESYSFLFSAEDGSFARVQFLVSNAGLEGHGKGAVRAVLVAPDGRTIEDGEAFESGEWGVQPEGAENFATELEAFASAIPEAAKAARVRETGATADQAQLDRVVTLMQRYEKLTDMAYILAVPPRAGSVDWRSIGQTLTQSITAGEIDPVVKLYASLGDAYRANDPATFNQAVDLLANRMAQLQPTGTKRARYEFLFNQVDPFTHSMYLYVLAFLLACGSWLGWNRPLNRSAFYLLLLTLAVHTFGLVSRMYLQERPPVTNLYSSAIFIGWGAVIVALILERIFRDGIGAACAGASGASIGLVPI